MPTSSQQQQTSSAINHNNNHNHHRATPDEPPSGGDAANNHDDKQNYEGFRSRLDERISNLQLSKREINLMRLNLSLLDFPNEIPPSLLNNNSGRNYGGGGYDGSRPPGDDLNCSNASQNNANIKLIKRLANVATVKIGTLQMFFFSFAFAEASRNRCTRRRRTSTGSSCTSPSGARCCSRRNL